MEDNLVTQSWNRGHPQPTTCACLAATISSKKITSKTSNAKLFAQCIPPVSCSRKVSSRLPHTPLTTIEVKYQGHGYPGQRHGRLIPSPIVRQSSKFKVHSISPNKEHEDIQYRLHIYKVGIYKHTESKYTKCISVPMSMVAVGNTPQTGYPSDHDTERSTPQYPKLQHSPQSACTLTQGPT